MKNQFAKLLKLLRDRATVRDAVESDRIVAKEEESEQTTQPHWVTGYDPITGKQIAQRLDGGTIKGDRISNAGVRHSTPVRVTSSETKQQNFLDWKPRVRVESPRRSVPPSPAVEQDAVAVLFRELSGKSIKVLFSKKSADGTKREFYVGGDREVPAKIHEVPLVFNSISNLVEAYLNNTGLEENEFIFACKDFNELVTIDNGTQYSYQFLEDTTPEGGEGLRPDGYDARIDAEFMGFGTWIGGKLVREFDFTEDDPYTSADESGVVSGYPFYSDNLNNTYGMTGTVVEQGDYELSQEITLSGNGSIYLFDRQWQYYGGEANYLSIESSSSLYIDSQYTLSTGLVIFDSSIPPLKSVRLYNDTELDPASLEREEIIFLPLLSDRQSLLWQLATFNKTIQGGNSLVSSKTFKTFYKNKELKNDPIFWGVTPNSVVEQLNPEAIALPVRISLSYVEDSISPIPHTSIRKENNNSESNTEFTPVDIEGLGLISDALIEAIVINPVSQELSDRYWKLTGTIVSASVNYANDLYTLVVEVDFTQRTAIAFDWKIQNVRESADAHNGFIYTVKEKGLQEIWLGANADTFVFKSTFFDSTLSGSPFLNPVPSRNIREAGSVIGGYDAFTPYRPILGGSTAIINFWKNNLNKISDHLYFAERDREIGFSDRLIYADSAQFVLNDSDQYEIELTGLRSHFCYSLQIPSGTPNNQWEIHSVSYYEQGTGIKIGGFGTPFELLQGLAEFAIASNVSKSFFLATFKEQQTSDRYNQLTLQYVNRRTQEIQQIDLSHPDPVPASEPWLLDWRKSLTQSYLLSPAPDDSPCVDKYRGNPYAQIKGDRVYLIDPYQLIGEPVEVPLGGVAIASSVAIGATSLQLTAPIGVTLTGGELLSVSITTNGETTTQSVGIRESVEPDESIVPIELIEFAIDINSGAIALKVFTNTFKILIQQQDVTIEVKNYPTSIEDNACVLGEPSIKRVKVKRIAEDNSEPQQIIGAFLLV